MPFQCLPFSQKTNLKIRIFALLRLLHFFRFLGELIIQKSLFFNHASLFGANLRLQQYTQVIPEYKDTKNMSRQIGVQFLHGLEVELKPQKSDVTRYAITDGRCCRITNAIALQNYRQNPYLNTKRFVDQCYRFPLRAFYSTPEQLEAYLGFCDGKFVTLMHAEDTISMKTVVG